MIETRSLNLLFGRGYITTHRNQDSSGRGGKLFNLDLLKKLNEKFFGVVYPLTDGEIDYSRMVEISKFASISF